MQISQKIDGSRITLSLTGRFDFNTHREFRDAYEAAIKTSGIKELEIDLASVDYLDSSALGMLLMLKERAGARNIQLFLTGCKGAVKQILDIANFGKLFNIS
ncbi:MAG: STAS domain-containing protein [Methylophilaceae bacterium]|nr:STAS domain-containing protein [Methylophilaceae bacterium]